MVIKSQGAHLVGAWIGGVVESLAVPRLVNVEHQCIQEPRFDLPCRLSRASGIPTRISSDRPDLPDVVTGGSCLSCLAVSYPNAPSPGRLVTISSPIGRDLSLINLAKVEVSVHGRSMSQIRSNRREIEERPSQWFQPLMTLTQTMT